MFDYEVEIQKRWRDNFKMAHLSSGRIESYCKRTGYPKRIVKAKIRQDDMFRWCFVVDPVRQNVFEKIAAGYIKSIPKVSSFRNYGTNELFIVAGAVKRGDDLDGMKPNSKSIDFGWIYGERQFYASHKYTNESGGAQDNQYKDVQQFIRNANEVGGQSVFIAIVDGQYYETKDVKADMSRRKRLEQMANHSNVFVKCIEEIEEFLVEFDD